MQRLGVTQAACRTMFQTLQELNHHVRTAFGEKIQGYGALGIPLHGVGQGNGAGPAIWLAITIPLVEMLRKAGFGLQVTTPITHETKSLACFVYVDDVDSIHAPIHRDHDTCSITAEMQRMLDTWAGGLDATGGMIESTKSYWYLIDFKWNTRKMTWEYKSVEETPATLYLRNPASEPIALQRKEAWEPDPDGTLGTFIAMDGNQRMVLQSLTHKVNQWADKIQTRQLTATEGWLSLRSGISTSIQHQLSTSRLTKKECRQITKKLKTSALKACGIPTTYPDALVYAPKEYLGLGLPDLWHIQAFLFIKQCLWYGSLPSDPTGILLRTVFQYMKIEMGVSKTPMSYPFKLWNKCVTPNQFFPIWEYLSDIHMELHDGLPDLPGARIHDRFLMEAFAEQGYTPSQLRLINLCRLHLQVYLLSDLTTGDGNHIDSSILSRQQPFPHHMHLRWPRTHPPSKHCWTLWKEAVMKSFISNHMLHPFRLDCRLGSWYRHIDRVQADTVYSPSTDIIYKTISTGQYQHYRWKRACRIRRPTYERSTRCTLLPLDVIPTTTTGNWQQLQHTGIARIIHPPPNMNPDWWGVVVHCSLPINDLLWGISQGTAFALTDGSFKDIGTAAFTLRSTSNDQRELTFVHMTPGMPSDINPYRAEVGGIFGIMAFLHRLTRLHGDLHGRITIACDCKGALQKAFQEHPPTPKQPNFDLLLEINRFRRDMNIEIETNWVKGHQDTVTNRDDLDHWTRINIAMDRLAKAHWERLDATRPGPFSLPASNGIWSLWQHGQRITRWDTDTANILYFNANARAFWAQKYQHFPSLDYEAIRTAYKNLSLFYQLRIPKWIGKRLPVGTRMVTWSLSDTAECPRCGTINEDHLHVATCQHPGAIAIVNTWLDQLELWLAKQNTQPTLRFGIISCLRAGFRDNLGSSVHVRPRDLCNIY